MQHQQQLVRHFISKRMAAYYAQSAESVVGETAMSCDSNSIAFQKLWGEWHWKRVYGRLYKQQKGQWLTPVELFQPYYSNSIANYIINTAKTTNATTTTTTDTADTSNNNDDDCTSMIDVIELGGGRGTNALCVLDHIQQKSPNLYNRIQSYKIIDSSPTLIELQRSRLLLHGDNNNSTNRRHADKIRIEQMDLLDVAEGRRNLFSSTTNANPDNTFVIALELLDNLPHDKIRLVLRDSGTGGGRTRMIVEEARIDDISCDNDENNNNHRSGSTLQKSREEIYFPLTDPLLKRVLDLVPSYYKQGTRTPAANRASQYGSYQWIPTVACGVLLQILAEKPNVNFLLADFDWLPPPDLQFNHTDTGTGFSTNPSGSAKKSYYYKPGRGEPLVTSMDDIDHPCYLHAPEFCDILFPTDFRKLAMLLEKVYNSSNSNNVKSVQIQKQADFLSKYGGPDQTQPTTSWLTGYSPLLHDFSNCSVLSTTASTQR